MKSEILYPGAFPMVRIELSEGEHLKAESGAMVACSPTIDIESKMEGGFLGALSRKFLTGEKFFFQTLRASRGPGEALLAPTVPGEIVILDLDGVNEYMVQKDGFLAGADSITIDSQMQSLSRGLLGGEGFFILEISGKGMLVLNSFGAIHKIELRPGQEYIVDNSHLVAWSATTSYNMKRPRLDGSPASPPAKALSVDSAGQGSFLFRVGIPVDLVRGSDSSSPYRSNDESMVICH